MRLKSSSQRLLLISVLVLLVFFALINIARLLLYMNKYNEYLNTHEEFMNYRIGAFNNTTATLMMTHHKEGGTTNTTTHPTTSRDHAENSTVLVIQESHHYDPPDAPFSNSSNSSTIPKEFCEHNLYRQTSSGITCKARVSFIMQRYHKSEEYVKAKLLEDHQNNCECKSLDRDIYNLRNKTKLQTIPNMFHTSASEVATTTSINNHSVSDLANQVFYQTPFHSHIKLRPSNYTHHNNYNDSVQLTYGKGVNRNVRISFELHDPMKVPLTNVFHPDIMTCRRFIDEKTDVILPPPLSRVVQNEDYPRGGRVLNLTATISTNLKILHIGDSVMVQLAQTFHEMVGCRNAALSGNGTGFCRPRVVLHESWRGHEGRSILAPTIGGGVSAMWRMTGLLSRSREGKPPANRRGGGWSMSEITSFFGPSMGTSDNTGSDVEQIDKRKHHGFDAVIFRVMHGWMSW